MNVLGLNAFHGDSAACLFVDGQLVSAAEEERFRRIKHWAGFPAQAIEFCLNENRLTLADIDVVAINSDSSAARFRKMAFALSGQASLKLIKEKVLVRQKRMSLAEHFEHAFGEVPGHAVYEHVEHHLAHLASAYLVSPFEQASVISIDGFGDFASAATGFGNGAELSLDQRVFFPHSMGVFYQALTQYLGFPHYGDEYKVMGLAPYGQPHFKEQMDAIVRETDGGQFKLNLEFFQHHKNAIGYEWEDNEPKVSRLYSDTLLDLLGPPRTKEQPLQQVHKDLARSIQDKYERVFFHMLWAMHQRDQIDSVCVAGGCGMNSVANGKIHLQTPFANVYVQSAAGDAGGAIGAATIACQRHGESKRHSMSHAYLGPQFSDQHCKQLIAENRDALDASNCEVAFDLSLAKLTDRVSDLIIQGKVIGWFQGAMEWGPRALGNRSILGDPRRSDMKDILNLKIKRRESFRPFAPSVLRREVSSWFESDADVPFMMKVFQIKESKRDLIPAVTHVDGSGRLQTVTKESNAGYHALIEKFFAKTQVPMLLNTSFNENEPVVCHPQEALDCFLRTNMDVLALGSHLIYRRS